MKILDHSKQIFFGLIKTFITIIEKYNYLKQLTLANISGLSVPIELPLAPSPPP